MIMQSEYPQSPAARSRWIVAERGFAPPKNQLDPWKPYAFLVEDEVGPSGDLIPTVTIFLTTKECPFRCLMCDLWLNTLDTRVPPGAIAAQIRHALDNLYPGGSENRSPGRRAQIKLYNAGSFFDPAAIPPEDYAQIARTVQGFERVIVESHPAFVGSRVLEFQRQLSGSLEIAIGLETVHPEILDRLNKRFTLDDFMRTAEFLARNRADLRVFLLLRPPFMSEENGLTWAKRSIEFAFDAGAGACCVIPTRSGNGAMERLADEGTFRQPRLRSLEAAVEYGISLGRGRVFADLWDLGRLESCSCSDERRRRMETMNRTQSIPPDLHCDRCAALP